jgi:DNA-binding MarR family transcriptional regulator
MHCNRRVDIPREERVINGVGRAPHISKEQYEDLAALRHALRRFLHFSQTAARAAGLTPQQHQALLAIKGYPGRDYVSVGELADRMRLRHHSTVELANRLADRGWVRRKTATHDRRRVELHLTARGEAMIEHLSEEHLRELRQLGPQLHRLMGTFMREEQKRSAGTTKK